MIQSLAPGCLELLAIEILLHTCNQFRLHYYDTLFSDDASDRVYDISRPMPIVWAIGRLNHKKEPLFHHLYPRGDVFVHFGSKTKVDSCTDFIKGWPLGQQRGSDAQSIQSWGPFKIVGNTVTQFIARIGPSGGTKGYSGITGKFISIAVGSIFQFIIRLNNEQHSTIWFIVEILKVNCFTKIAFLSTCRCLQLLRVSQSVDSPIPKLILLLQAFRHLEYHGT